MTIGYVLRGNVVLFAIPATCQRGVTVQEPPAPLPEGVAAGFRAENPLLVSALEDLAMAAVAPVGEIAGSGELLTCRRRI